jgi:hypothetical protein
MMTSNLLCFSVTASTPVKDGEDVTLLMPMQSNSVSRNTAREGARRNG